MNLETPSVPEVWARRQRVRQGVGELGVGVLDVDPAADRQPLGDAVRERRRHIDGREPGLDRIVAAEPVVVVLDAQPPGCGEREAAPEIALRPERPRVECGRHRRHRARVALVARQGNGRAAGGGRARRAVAIVDVVARIHDRHPGKRLRAVDIVMRPGCERPCWHPRPQPRCPHWRDRPAGRPGPARRSRSLQPTRRGRGRPGERASRRRSRLPPARAAATMQAASSRCTSARRPRCAARPPACKLRPPG